MLRFIVFAAVLGLVGGLAGAFAFNELSGQADALAPLATRVREQNLDASGLIRVHEQGVADVNVLSTPPLAAPAGRTILVAENVTIPAGPNSHTTNFVATADCLNMAVFIEMSGSLSPIELNLSGDGVTSHGVVGAEAFRGSGANRVAYFQVLNGMPVVSPNTSVTFFNNSGVDPLVIDRAWLYCSR